MFAQESVMDIKKLKAEFEKLKYVEEKLEYLSFDEHLGCYVEKNNGMPVGLAAWVNGAFYGFEQAAKAQAVPEGFVIKDVINERQRQINQEFYSTENDDEYKQNELLRAAVCYAENVIRRGWVFDSNFGPDVYQEEEVPDLWPWDLDFWKPRNPRRDLVRAAALLIAEIERIDRSTGASQ